MKTPLTLTRADGDRNVYGAAKDTFTVMINPEQMRHEQKLCYDRTKAQGQKGQEIRFAAVTADKVAFDIVLDATGVVRQQEEDESITEQLRKLRSIVYELGDKAPQPSHVRLLWGTFLFFGRLESLTTNFTLFKPNGEPLRAKLSLAFVGSVRHDKKELKDNGVNNNLVQTVQVRAGDTLPLLCEQILGDASCYLEVASQNDLDCLHPLEPGMQLEFSPGS